MAMFAERMIYQVDGRPQEDVNEEGEVDLRTQYFQMEPRVTSNELTATVASSQMVAAIANRVVSSQAILLFRSKTVRCLAN